MKKQVISYEDHLIVMLWEVHLRQDNRNEACIISSLDKLSTVLTNLRRRSKRRYLHYSEDELLENLKLIFIGKDINHRIYNETLAKIHLLLN